MYFVYGNPTQRFCGVGVPTSSGVRYAGIQAWSGFCEATREKSLISFETLAWCSGKDFP